MPKPFAIIAAALAGKSTSTARRETRSLQDDFAPQPRDLTIEERSRLAYADFDDAPRRHYASLGLLAGPLPGDSGRL
jgi:hypothetical protein